MAVSGLTFTKPWLIGLSRLEFLAAKLSPDRGALTAESRTYRGSMAARALGALPDKFLSLEPMHALKLPVVAGLQGYHIYYITG